MKIGQMKKIEKYPYPFMNQGKLVRVFHNPNDLRFEI
jgi:hypothetical protein